MSKKITPEGRDRKALFIDTLAEFLAGNQVGKGIELQLNPRPAPLTAWPQEWAKLRDATPLFGYPTVEEAVKQLTEFLK